MNIFRKNFQIELAAPALIMAFGIFFIGAYEMLGFLHFLERVLIWGFIAFALIIFILIIIHYRKRTVWHQLIDQPVKLFALGTWVAALSVFTLVLKEYTNINVSILQMLTVCNMILLFTIFIIYLFSFRKLFKRKDLKVDGIVLLSTVSMQSIVIMTYHMFGEQFHIFFKPVIILGIAFYILGIYFIWQTYKKEKWTLANDWANTNCIIHGALSITGLAMTLTESFSLSGLMFIFVITTILLIFIEIVECIRMIQRIKLYHLRDGILSYHVTQWSRNFTFGMYFTFIYTMQQNDYFQTVGWLAQVMNGFLSFWASIVFFFLLFEFILFIDNRLKVFIKS